MAELTFKSAGVSTREIDLSGPTAIRPQGIPAGVIGTSQKGPAFVPITVATYQDFVAEFGATDGKKFGPLAMSEWMKNARSGLFVRVLGAGNAQKRNNDGDVTNAGFVVGSQNPQDTDVHDGGLLGNNPSAGAAAADFDADGDGAADDDQVLGRTYFLGALTREEYDTSGEAAAVARLTLDPTAFIPAQFTADDAKGEAVRFTDSTANVPDDTATLWFHEGPDHLTSAGLPPLTGDLAPYEDDKNLFVSVGARGTAILNVANNTMAGTYAELTDVDGNQWQAQFLDGGAPTDGSIVQISGLAEAAIAAQIVASIGASALEADVSADGADVTVTMQSFGNPSDEPDGGAFIAAHLVIQNSLGVDIRETPANNAGWGGEVFTASELTKRVVEAVDDAATPLVADLVFSADDDDLVVTQGTVGIAGNNDEAADPGLAVISHDWVHDEASVSITGLPVDLDTFTITDANGDSVVLTFVESTTPAAEQVSCSIDVVAEATITTSGVGASLIAGDTVTMTATNDDTLLVTIIESGVDGTALPLANAFNAVSAVHPYEFTVDLSAVTALGVSTIPEILEGVINAATIAITATAAADDVELAQDTAGTDGDGAVGTNFQDVNDFSVNGSVEFTGGIDEATDVEMATRIHALIGASVLDVIVSLDAPKVTVEQMQAGAVTAFTDGDGTPIADAMTEDPDGTDVAGASGTEFNGDLDDDGDDQPAGLLDAVTNFTGGGDPVDGDPKSWDLRDAGIDTQANSVPLIRAILMTPAGVRPSLVAHSADHADAVLPVDQAPIACANSADAFGDGVGDLGLEENQGSQVGLVNLAGTQERFVLLLNGHTNSSEFPNVITASFDPQAPDYFMNVFNHDSACTEDAGHYVYSHYNVFSDHAAVDVSGHDNVPAADAGRQPAAFLLRGSQVGGLHAAAPTTHPNYELFQDRFRTARSPWVMSQIYGANPKNLFRLHALDDGVAGSGKFKISVANISMDSSGGYGTFDVFVRAIDDTDTMVVAYEKFIGLDLNPRSERYIARVIGDLHMYYDFDKRVGSQKLVVDGIHPSRSKYIRVEMDAQVDAGTVPQDALPLGYRGYWHLRTDVDPATTAAGDCFLENPDPASVPHASAGAGAGVSPLQAAKVPPVPMRRTIAKGIYPKLRPDSTQFWGTQFQVNDDRDEPNKNVKFNDAILSYCKYLPLYHSSSVNPYVGDNEGAELSNGAVVDADLFNNNSFSLERIQVVTKLPTVISSQNPNVSGKVDHKQWAVNEYRRDGILSDNVQTLEQLNIFDGDVAVPHADVPSDEGGNPTISSRFLDPQTDMIDSSTRRYMKFSFFLQGGFDGTSIFDANKYNLRDIASAWEMRDVDQGGVAGSTVAAFRKAVDVMAEKADVDIKLLAIPGMRNEAITDYAVDAVEDRFDAMYIMDVAEKSVSNENMIDYGSQKPSVNLTVEDFSGRNLDTSFAAAYFPDVVITDPKLQTNVQCPPSVAVLGAFSLNDSVAHPWFAPAGFTRGALKSVLETQVKLSRKNLDTLYESDINPLAAFPHTPGVVVWGQKTLQQAQSALDRVNVRRLLIEIRREVRRVGNTLLFEPNREETLGRFSAAVNPILQRIQQQQGLDKFKVVIDTTTTTQADVENNTVRGKIFLQPTRTIEFISLDFVITNAGTEV